MPQFKTHLAQSLQHDLPYDFTRLTTLTRMGLAKKERSAAVLILFAQRQSLQGAWEILLTKRAVDIGVHSGQIAFPGGACEAGDQDDPENTALRETKEEIGLDQSRIQIVGSLPKLSTFVSSFQVTPIVGIYEDPLERCLLDLNQNEIAEAFWVPWVDLIASYKKESVRVGPVSFPTHAYYAGTHRVWGATGAMIRNLEQRLGFVP